MRTFTPLAILAAVLAAAIFTFSGPASPSNAADGPPDAADVPTLPEPANGEEDSKDAEVQTRGPVHEAFASPVDLNPQASEIVKKEPPAPIDEVPPDQRPEGDNVIWIPGYFAWDDDRGDFLWVSGVWRNVPPGQTWVAGYWNKVADGWQWTSGFWTGAKKAEVSYQVEAPPQSLETGPNSPSPSDNHFWIPGNWVYQDRYQWQPGYWSVAQPNWVWIPAHWMWTPGGYVFVGGFWDYEPAYRGCLFAPVYFTSAIYSRPHFVWCPGVVINVGFFSGNLFCGPRRCNYYFGDYYSSRCAGLGFRPFFEVNVGRRVGYDPLFAYYRQKNLRSDPNWAAQQKQHFEKLQNNAADRPPATFLAQKEWMQKHGDNNGPGKNSNFVAATTLKQAAKEPGVTGFKLQNVSQQNRQEMLKQAETFNKFSKQRLDVEKQNMTAGSSGSGGVGSAGGAGGATGAGEVKRGAGTTTKLPNQTLKLPTIAKTQIDKGNDKGAGAGSGQTMGQGGQMGQLGQSGDTGSGQGRNKFNKQQLSGATGQDQTPGGKPNLGSKINQSMDQDKTGNQGMPFGQNKPNVQDKTSDENPARNKFTPRNNPLAKPDDDQDKPSGGTQNKLVIPKGSGQQSAVDQGAAGKPIMGQGSGGQGSGGQGSGGQGSGAQGSGSGKPTKTMIVPQGSGGQGGGGQGGGGESGMSRSLNIQGGGGGGGGGNQQRNNPQPKKDKDDDQQQQQQNKKGNRSDTTSPSTNFAVQRNNSSGVDAGGMATAEKTAMKRDISGTKESWAKQALEDKLTNENIPPASSSRSNAKPQLSQGLSSETPAGGGNAKLAGPSGAATSTDKLSPKGGSGSSPGGSSLSADPRSLTGSTPANPGSLSIYRNLQQRGKSLSQSGTGSSPSGAADNGSPDARSKKDPVGSYSYGSSPTRNPTMSSAYGSNSYGSVGNFGFSPRAAGSPSGSSGGGLGSIQKYQPGQMPQFQRGGGFNSSGAGGSVNSDPGTRTYDPTQESTGTYNPSR